MLKNIEQEKGEAFGIINGRYDKRGTGKAV